MLRNCLAKAKLLALFGALWLGACPARSTAIQEPESPSDPLSASAIMSDVERLCADDFQGRGSYQPGSALASQWVYGEFRKMGYRVLRQPIRGRHAENIIAVKEGDSRAVIVSAHHDHLGRIEDEVYLGADDNASGLAVLLAMARSSAELDFRHTLIFISFGAEEDGLVGSAAYVRDPFWPLKQTKALINFDMVGRNFFEAGADQASTAAVVGLEASKVAERAVMAAASAAGLNLISVPARLLELFDLHDRTDDWWFRRQEIPAYHFSTGLHPDYHQVTDTVDKIVPDQLARIASTASALLDALARKRNLRRPPKPPE